MLKSMPSVKHLVFFDGGKKPKLEGYPNSVQVYSLSSVDALGSKPANLRSKF
jgi:hypothetical protein